METDDAIGIDPAPPPAAAKADAPPRRAHGGDSAGKLLLEAALIVLSVLLGFAVNEWQQRQSERELTRTVLANFRRELELNLATLRRIQPRHARLTARLDSAAAATHGDSTAFQVFAARMQGGVDLVPLKEAAWEAASATGALRLLPYETAAALSETYVVQQTFRGQTLERFSTLFFSPENFDPAAQQRMVRAEAMMMNEVTQQEANLIEIYQSMLRRLPAAGRA